ncbi:MAG: (Fe-S)-binding protein [Planctomycetia bacterium]|nr:(Fe-S)-binding protein [Planctomycetia bacterium]
MQVGLFIPCYIDQFYPQVGLATVEVLERQGVEVDFPAAQTCCGQPLANTGCLEDARPLARNFFNIFQKYEYVVCPSGSCTAMVRHHYEQFFPGDHDFEEFSHRVFELCEFLTDVLHVERIDGKFPHRVGLHQSCHGLRELRLAKSSELVAESFNKAQKLLGSLEGIEFSELTRSDECCGFGGTFAVAEEAVSCMMGRDRIFDHERAGTQVLTALDMSCLMHLDGLLRRDKKTMRVMHVAEILAGREV